MRDVFVSKPSAVAEYQTQILEGVETALLERSLRPRTLGTTDYPNIAPVDAVKEVMSECHGAVILGLKQIRVIRGVAKEGTEKEEALAEYHLPTAWNHIEAGMAFALGQPVLIIREEGVSGGVFEVGSSDRYIHEVTVPGDEWLRSDAFLQPLNRWVEDVIRHDAEHR